MNLYDIEKRLKQRDAGILGQDTEFRRYSVLIPLIEIDNKLNVLFEVRSKNLRSQPGEISFPGGRIEKGENSLHAAVRETCEEINVKEEDIEILGSIDVMVTQHGKIIYPYAAKIRGDAKIIPSKQEVDSVFYVPFNFFLETEPVIRTVKIITEPVDEFPYDDMEKAKEYNWAVGKSNIYFYKYENYIIWGLTAKMMYYFIQAIK